ncbi:glycosyltransferase family 4 protein [Merismopedia glauca]|uniref:Glycoside hydrolase n=1 Tax=Merismopedia glauca CCAP 1448/3 TaxID=1296344 RepID=A0A2T1C592_9CYAN|nr:glycosyltransferase family 1 protein [Merismopedia glauca]PSB03421.1 glycoside hydrolase [Merismopedia glauca CCAP 1448/3]
MVKPKSQHIALISVHGDPAIEVGKEEAGGQNVYVRNVGEALGALGWQVDMFTRKANATDPKIVQHTPNCRTIRLTAGSEEFIPRDHLFEYLPEFIDQFLAFQQEIGIEYPLVHTNYWMSAWVGMELKKRQNIKQIHTYHSLGAVKYKSVSSIPAIAKTRLNTEKLVLETAERIVATSPQEKEHMRSLVSLKGKIDIIPCGTDISRFGQVSQAVAREKIGISSDSQVVFYVGRFDPRKGIETLVRAIAHSQLRGDGKLKLIIGGGSRPGQADGLERERIEAIVNELKLREITTFTGRIDDADLPHYYAAADICVVPSHYEPFGLVAIEAMASRTAVVASDVGGLQFTVVPEMTGLLCPPQDAIAFSKAIDRILTHPQWCQQLGDRARQRVEQMFSWSGVAVKLSQLYTTCLVSQTLKPLEVY